MSLHSNMKAKEDNHPTFELNKSLVEKFGPMENDEIDASDCSVGTKESAQKCFDLISTSFLDFAIKKWDLRNRL